ncbi:MAG: PQQ-dependent sugar dehydrogenase [Candidatus Phaeomarinobacter sp.]
MIKAMERLTFTGVVGAAALVAAGTVAAPVLAQAVTAAPDGQFNVETVASGRDYTWSIAFLPDGDMLVTELTGQLRLIDDGVLVDAPISGTPDVIFGGQGGLSDVVLHPDFADNKLIYLTYSAARDKGNTLVVARAEFNGTALENFEEIFEANAYRSTKVHYGARMAFLPDGTFLVTNGDGFDYREQSQNTENHFGAVVRLNEDGSVPADNPYVGDDSVLDEIFTYGHRNPQAIVYDAASGRIYSNEHGAQGGDEINIIEAKGNYGWPLATYGLDYSGAYVSPLTEFEGSTQPLTYWTPSIAPSGMAVVSGEAFSDWDGDLLVTALAAGNVEEFADRNLRRVVITDGELTGEEAVRVAVPGGEDDDTERLRDVRMAPDGSIYVLTDGEGGHVLRLVPVGGMPQDTAAAIEEARDAVGEATQAVIEAVTEGAKAAADIVEEVIDANKDDVADAVNDAVEATAEAVKEGAEAVKDAVSSDTPAE